uniref:Actin like 7A n=1 Tax=Bubo bubo TaxID=30461 RepID=A0A8C0EHA7_BUBBB
LLLYKESAVHNLITYSVGRQCPLLCPHAAACYHTHSDGANSDLLLLEKNKDAMKEMKAVVVDMGTDYFRCGFAGDPWPFYIVSSTAGKSTQETGSNQKETFVRRELQSSSIPLTLANPIRHSIVVDWNCTEMKIQPEDHAFPGSVPPLCSITDKERYAEMMFKGFHMPAIDIAYQSQLSMYSYRKTSALVVESGHGVSHVVPICEGYVICSITERVDYAGLDITHYLMKLLNESGNVFTEHQLNIVQDIKEKCCYTSLDLTQDLNGHLITAGKERFLCAETLFKPALLGSQQPGLLQLTLSWLKKCYGNVNKKMVENILLCGGSTMMEGFANHFQMELAKMCPSDNLITATLRQRMSSVWIGGSILASLHSFQVYRTEYEEHGPSCLFKKCL